MARAILTRILHIRISAKEQKIHAQSAKATNVKVSEWIRRALISTAERERNGNHKL